MIEKIDFYKLSKEKVLDFFKVDLREGLRDSDLGYKEKKYGLNTIEIKKDETFFEIFLEQARSFLNILLLCLVFFAFIVWLFTKQIDHLIDSIIIFTIFLFNTLIGAYQNYSAKKIAKALSKMLENEALVLRNSKKVKINAKQIFPGDIVYLSGGDKIPADCYLIEANDLKVDESFLTGESIPVHKKVCVIDEKVPASQRKNMLFMNSYVVSGDAVAVIVKTGKNTEIGNIADSLQDKERKISFITEIDVVSKKISYFAIGLIIFVGFVLYYKGLDIINILLVGSALIIGSIPEGLPAIVIFLMSKSIHKLAKEKILVKDMGLLETLGSIDILCTDKTGTLTQNKMTLKKMFLNGKLVDDFSKINPKIKELLLKTITYVNDVKTVNGEVKGEPEDIALINYADDNGYDVLTRKDINNVLHYEPFNSDDKYSYSNNSSNIYFYF